MGHGGTDPRAQWELTSQNGFILKTRPALLAMMPPPSREDHKHQIPSRPRGTSHKTTSHRTAVPNGSQRPALRNVTLRTSCTTVKACPLIQRDSHWKAEHSTVLTMAAQPPLTQGTETLGRDRACFRDTLKKKKVKWMNYTPCITQNIVRGRTISWLKSSRESLGWAPTSLPTSCVFLNRWLNLFLLQHLHL